MYQSEERIHLHDAAQNEVAGNGSGIGIGAGDEMGMTIEMAMAIAMEMHWLSSEFSAIMRKTRLAQRIMKLKLLQKVFGDRYESEDQESAFFPNTSESSWIKCVLPTRDSCVCMCVCMGVYTPDPTPVQPPADAPWDALICKAALPPSNLSRANSI